MIQCQTWRDASGKYSTERDCYYCSLQLSPPLLPPHFLASGLSAQGSPLPHKSYYRRSSSTLGHGFVERRQDHHCRAAVAESTMLHTVVKDQQVAQIQFGSDEERVGLGGHIAQL